MILNIFKINIKKSIIYKKNLKNISLIINFKAEKNSVEIYLLLLKLFSLENIFINYITNKINIKINKIKKIKTI